MSILSPFDDELRAAEEHQYPLAAAGARRSYRIYLDGYRAAVLRIRPLVMPLNPQSAVFLDELYAEAMALEME